MLGILNFLFIELDFEFHFTQACTLYYALHLNYRRLLNLAAPFKTIVSFSMNFLSPDKRSSGLTLIFAVVFT